jgi:hypothetical protein
MTSSHSQNALANIRGRLDTETREVPRESVERHYQNLERLAGSLKALGMNEEQVDTEVMQVFGEYQQLLSEYIAGRQGGTKA